MIEPLITSTLTVEFNDMRTAKAVNNALLPDNIDIPSGMKIEQALKGRAVRVTVSVENLESVTALISTLDEFVTHMQAAVATLGKVTS